MKAIKTILAGMLVLVMVMGLTACGGSSEGSSSTSSVSASSTTTDNGYTFTSGSTVIVMGAEAADIIDALGEPKNYFESESCAFEGLDKVYSYSGFKLNTYPVDDVDYILSVVFSDDTVETDLGITIGSSKDDVLAAYGDPTEEKTAALIYESGNTKITFGISGDTVATVEISAITE